MVRSEIENDPDYLTLEVPLGPALGSPVWHGVSGSPRELNCVERSLQRDLPSAPHSQPESEETTQTQRSRLTGGIDLKGKNGFILIVKPFVLLNLAWWVNSRRGRETLTWSSSCAFLLRRSASSFSCSFLPRSSSSWLSCYETARLHLVIAEEIHVSQVILMPTMATLKPDWRAARERTRRKYRSKTITYQIQTSLLSLLYFMLEVFTFFSLLAQLTFLEQRKWSEDNDNKSSTCNLIWKLETPLHDFNQDKHRCTERVNPWKTICNIMTNNMPTKDQLSHLEFAEYIGFSFHNDLWHDSSEVLQSLASFNYSKCSLHVGPV